MHSLNEISFQTVCRGGIHRIDKKLSLHPVREQGLCTLLKVAQTHIFPIRHSSFIFWKLTLIIQNFVSFFNIIHEHVRADIEQDSKTFQSIEVFVQEALPIVIFDVNPSHFKSGWTAWSKVTNMLRSLCNSNILKVTNMLRSMRNSNILKVIEIHLIFRFMNQLHKVNSGKLLGT